MLSTCLVMLTFSRIGPEHNIQTSSLVSNHLGETTKRFPLRSPIDDAQLYGQYRSNYLPSHVSSALMSADKALTYCSSVMQREQNYFRQLKFLLQRL